MSLFLLRRSCKYLLSDRVALELRKASSEPNINDLFSDPAKKPTENTEDLPPSKKRRKISHRNALPQKLITCSSLFFCFCFAPHWLHHHHVITICWKKAALWWSGWRRRRDSETKKERMSHWKIKLAVNTMPWLWGPGVRNQLQESQVRFSSKDEILPVFKHIWLACCHF